YDLRSWELWSGHRAGAVAGRQGKASRKQADRSGSRSRAADAHAMSIRGPRAASIVRVVSPVLLDPGAAFDDFALDPGLDMALTETGWESGDVLRRRWLRLATMHVSYLYEHHGDIPINAELLRMLDSLGSRWCRLYTLEAFVSSNPLASAHEQSRAWAEYSAPMIEHLTERLDVDQAILLGRGEASTSRDPGRRYRTHESVARQIIGVLCLLGGLPCVSKITKAVYPQIVTRVAPATD